jgi:hypothetical protein
VRTLTAVHEETRQHLPVIPESSTRLKTNFTEVIYAASLSFDDSCHDIGSLGVGSTSTHVGTGNGRGESGISFD